jgi:hypothetical protein
MFSHGSEDVDGEAVGLREVTRNELHSRLHECADEGDVAGEAVELGNDKGRIVNAAEFQSLRESGTVGTLSRLNLSHLSNEGPRPTVEEGPHRLALRLKAETGTTLPSGRDPNV